MELKLKAQKRKAKENIGADELAAVVYGKGLETQALKLNRSEFNKVFNIAGESNLIEIDLDGTKTKTIVKEIQNHPVKDWIRHVDFYQVNMDEVIDAEIPLHFVGESEAVKLLGGILIKEVNDLSVECLPGDLINNIDVDISVLKTIDDVIRVKDLNVPKTMTSLLDDETIVAMIAQAKEEEEPEPEETEEGEAGEEGKEGKDGKEGKEGEAKDDKDKDGADKKAKEGAGEQKK